MPLPPSLITRLKRGDGAIVVEAPLAAHAYVLVDAVRGTGKPVVHVLPSDKDLAATAALCEFLAPGTPIIQFPAWDTLPYDRVSPSHAITAARLNALSMLAAHAVTPSPLAGEGRDEGALKSGAKLSPPLTQPSPARGEGLTTVFASALKASPYILLTTVNAITQKLPPREQLAKARFHIKKSSMLKRDALIEFLHANGYSRVGKVMESGEYAVRGSLIDLFPSGYEQAVRIDMFGDEVESLRSFDPLTQISDAALESLELRAVSEVLLQPETIARFRSRYLAMFGAVTQGDPLYESISEGRIYQGMEHWLPLFYEQLDSLADYCDGAILSVDHRLEALMHEREEAIQDYYGARTLHQRKDTLPYNPVPPEQLFLTHDRFVHSWRSHTRMTLTPFAVHSSYSPHEGESKRIGVSVGGNEIRDHELPPHDVARATSAPPQGGSFSTGLRLSPQLFNRRHEEGQHLKDVILDYINAADLPVILAANSAGSADRIGKMLGLAAVATSAVAPSPLAGEGWDGGASKLSGHLPSPLTHPSAARGEGLPVAPLTTHHSPFTNTSIITLPIEQGFTCPEFILLTEQDMFGERIIRTQKRKRKSEAFLAEAASFIEGELIVHREHGIGRFEGLITVEVNDTRHDCLKLAYDGGTLFLPVENIDLVSRYGTAEGEVLLDKLGGVAWQRRKSALKKRLKMAAEALIKVAAERAAIAAPVLTPEAGLYDEFVARFPYSETDDQLTAIDEVRADLSAGHAMDRLVCGDVGFGKTEVALRAAFIAASSGQQVAVIAPTTLLARQHFHTFSARFKGLPFTVRMLSRMTTAKDAAETKALLPEGKVDIVVGTHALLAGNVQFKNLGLLIVDEEQHFGVAQKEKLKQLKANIHVLTLSATPIPRTLQLSLSGVRELSLITTPPVDRLAVRTYVMPYDPVVLREAILREYHRGGKVFVVTPRVKYIAELQQKLEQLVPEIKIVAAHGQMGAMALDKTMNAFYDGKYDLLLSTTIIESGIDIPTANTIIIDRADMFGLSQLYQLRGRVGRSKTRAYAYLTLPHGKLLTHEAERRLEVMQQLDTLGAGFQLASHDMDIRGFGNLLGEEQSGHVKEVGIELYQAMLEEAIADMKRKKDVKRDDETPDAWSPQINLGMSVLIPESYVEDLPLRLSLYRRAAGLTLDADLEGFAAELVDRFGPSPIEVEHFIATLRIKAVCKGAGIARLDAGPKGIVLAFRNNKFANPTALIDHIAKHTGRIKLRGDQTLFIAAETKGDEERLKTASMIAAEIAALLPKPSALAA